MVEQAAYHPAQSQWLIEHEGLKHMGFQEIENTAVQMVSPPFTLHFRTVADYPKA